LAGGLDMVMLTIYSYKRQCVLLWWPKNVVSIDMWGFELGLITWAEGRRD